MDTVLAAGCVNTPLTSTYSNLESIPLAEQNKKTSFSITNSSVIDKTTSSLKINTSSSISSSILDSSYVFESSINPNSIFSSSDTSLSKSNSNISNVNTLYKCSYPSNFVDKKSIQCINQTSENYQNDPKLNLTKSEKKHQKREAYRLRRRQQRPSERRNRREKQRQQVKSILSNFSQEEIIEYKKNEKEKKLNEIEIYKAHEEYAYNNGLKICINCCFEDMMNEKELGSLAKQLFLAYHSMRKSSIPLQFHYTSFSNDSCTYTECMKYSIDLWRVHTHENPFWEVFEKDEIIILSPDAPEELESFDWNKIYVIGGLVDRSVHTNQTYHQALRMNFKSQKLPIKKFLTHNYQNILNINHVIDIILYYLQNFDWLSSLKLFVPERKQLPVGRKALRKQKKILKYNNTNDENKNEINLHQTEIILSDEEGWNIGDSFHMWDNDEESSN